MSRTTFIGRSLMGGCRQCHGDDAHWFSKNTQGLAARHHDQTGHETWVDVSMTIRYGGEVSTAVNAKEKVETK
jgi:hypothetical protein